MMPYIDLAIRFFTLYFLTIIAHVSFQQGKKLYALFLFPMWLVYFRLSLLRIIQLRLGVFGNAPKEEFMPFALLIQDGMFPLVVDLLFLSITIVVFIELRKSLREVR